MKPQHFNWRALRDPDQEGADNKAHRAALTQLVLDDEEIKEDGRRCCKNNLLCLAYVLGYCLIQEDVHHEAIQFFPDVSEITTVEEIYKGIKRRRTLLYPRNTYKSTLDMVFCMALILRFYMTICILIMSGGKDLAFSFVDQIASFFIKPLHRQATLFQALFPELCQARPQRESGVFTCGLRQTEPKIIAPMIWGNSIDSNTTGWHPDVLIYDDIHTNRNSLKYDGRVRITKAYKLTRKILKPTGIEIKIGTPYGLGDTFTDEVTTAKPGTYQRIMKPAMRLRSGERLDPNGFPAEDEVELLFPTILSYDFLAEEYAADFEFFMSQYMIDSYGASELVFTDTQIIAAMIEERDMPMEGHRFIHWRLPCKSLNWHRAACAVGIMQRNRMFITETHQGQYKPSVLARLIHDVARENGTHSVSIEDSPGAMMLLPAIRNYSLTTGWDIAVTWTEYQNDQGERDTRIRNLEPLLAGNRLFFSNGLKTRPLVEGFVQYGMSDESSLADVISRVAGNLPVSIAATELEEEELAWEMMRENDRYNMIYGRGPYRPPEPEPEEIEVPVETIEDRMFNDQGLEVMIPGLE